MFVVIIKLREEMKKGEIYIMGREYDRITGIVYHHLPTNILLGYVCCLLQVSFPLPGSVLPVYLEASLEEVIFLSNR